MLPGGLVKLGIVNSNIFFADVTDICPVHLKGLDPAAPLTRGFRSVVIRPVGKGVGVVVDLEQVVIGISVIIGVKQIAAKFSDHAAIAFDLKDREPLPPRV